LRITAPLDYFALLVGLLFAAPQFALSQNACDLDRNGTVNETDVNLARQMSLGQAACPGTFATGVCDVLMVQRVIHAALGNPCVPRHAFLTWTASSSPNVAGYNVYRATVLAGPYARVNTDRVVGTTYTDSNIQAGVTYYYLARAVDAGGTESADSNVATWPPPQ
jgi:hypothetical protein